MRALIFDFDGTILDTETPEFRVWTDLFASHGVSMPDGYWASLIGRGAEQEMERPAQLLRRLTGLEVDTPEAEEARRVVIRAMIDAEPIRPGVLELLTECAAGGIRLAVASSSKHAWVDRYLPKLGLASLFEAVLCADDVARAKPFPDLYLAACEALGVKPEEAIAIEDSPNGTAASLAAGVFTVAVPNSVTAALDLSHADAVLPTLAGVTVEHLDALRLAGSRRRSTIA